MIKRSTRTIHISIIIIIIIRPNVDLPPLVLLLESNSSAVHNWIWSIQFRKAIQLNTESVLSKRILQDQKKEKKAMNRVFPFPPSEDSWSCWRRMKKNRWNRWRWLPSQTSRRWVKLNVFLIILEVFSALFSGYYYIWDCRAQNALTAQRSSFTVAVFVSYFIYFSCISQNKR